MFCKLNDFKKYLFEKEWLFLCYTQSKEKKEKELRHQTKAKQLDFMFFLSYIAHVSRAHLGGEYIFNEWNGITL